MSSEITTIDRLPDGRPRNVHHLMDPIPEVTVPSVPGQIDEIEKAIVDAGGEVQRFGDEVELCDLEHLFLPGLYVRQIVMPAGALVTTKIHKTRHPYAISQGAALVFREGEGSMLIQAPYHGVTEPGTRRVLWVLQEMIWTTYHPNPTDIQDVEEMERELAVAYQNPLVEEAMI